jgi:hypothetical protein
VPYIGQDLQVAFPSYTNIDDISGSFDGVTTSFPLTVGGVAPVPAPLGSNQCLISVDGVVQRPDDTGTEGFRLSGGNIIFSSAPSIADDFFGIILAGADYVNVGANFPDGTLGAPSITFDQDNDTGYYRSGSGAVSFASNGVAAGTWSSAGVTAPALIPTGSSVPANGVYLPAANTVGVATNGTGRLFVDASGKVGVGTASPAFSNGDGLEIQRDGTACLRLDDNTNSKAGEIFADSTGLNIDARGTSAVLNFDIGGSTKATLDNSGRLLVGTSTARAGYAGGNNFTPYFQIEGNSDGTRYYSFTNNSNAIAPSAPVLNLTRSRSSSIGGTTLVQSGDWLGALSFNGYDGTNPIEAATIKAEVDGTPGANDMPGRLVFATTADGASSPTERLRITSAGLVGIGTTPNSDSRLHVKSGANDSNPVLRLEAATNNFLNFRQTGSVYDIHVTAGDPLSFTIGASERARIDSSGRLLVGTSSARTNYFNTTAYGPLLNLEGTSNSNRVLAFVHNDNSGASILVLGATGGSTAGSNTLISSVGSCGIFSFQGADGSELVEAARIACDIDGTPGANDMPGRLVFSTTADGASSPTERMRIDSGGAWYLNTTSNTLPTGNGVVWTGGELRAGNESGSGGVVLELNRQNSDGDLVRFYQASAQEGAISVSGTTVTYGGGHLARWSQLPNSENPSQLLKGTVMSNLDEMCDWDEEDNEQLNKTKVSDVEGDKNVAGVFVSTSFSDDGPLDFFVAMTGDMVIRIAADTTVERGDLLMSAGDGTAKPQDDDIIRSKTIAKVTSTNVSCTYEDGSYCVPCMLMAC